MIKIKDRYLNLPAANLPNTKELAETYGHNQIIKLFYNENKFGASPKVKERIEIKSPHIYPEYKEPELTKALSETYKMDINNFYISNGSDAILDMIPSLFASVSDKQNVIIPELTFGRIETTCQVRGLEVKKVNLLNGKIDLEATLKQIDSKTALIYIVNPNMPHGTLNTHEEMISFLSKVPSNVLVVIDEAYYEYAIGIDQVYIDDKKIIEAFDNVIITHTFSKCYGLAAFRVGYMISRPYIVDVLRKSYQYLPVNKYSLQAAEAALSDKEYYDNVIKLTNIEKDKYYKTLDSLSSKGIGYLRSFGNFIYVEVPKNKEFYEYLLKTYGVAIRPVRSNALRITIGTPDENELVFKAFKEFYE